MKTLTLWRFGVMVWAAGILVPAHAVTYVAKVLHPTSGYSTSSAWASNGYTQVGIGNVAGAQHALTWTGSPLSVVDLTPFGGTAAAYGTYGSTQVGQGNNHPCLWHGSAATFVDLLPSGCSSGIANAVWGYTQVGVCTVATGSQHAFKWTGTAAGAVDLNPIGYSTSNAHSTDSWGQIAGEAWAPTLWWTNVHAALWDSGGVFHDLNPSGFTDTICTSTEGAVQAGYGLGPATSSYTHAILWNGSASSAIDVHPSAYQETGICSTSYGISAGWRTEWGSYNRRALAWTGATSIGTIDLHALLSSATYMGMPQNYVSSMAMGVDGKGNIVGYATTDTGQMFAILWVPI